MLEILTHILIKTVNTFWNGKFIKFMPLLYIKNILVRHFLISLKNENELKYDTI